MTASIASLDLGRPAAVRPELPGMTTGAVRTWLRLEGLAAFGLGIALYAADRHGLAVPHPVAPAAGRLRDRLPGGPRIGTFTYNLFHQWAPGFIALAIGALARLGRDPARSRRSSSPTWAWTAPSATA